MTVPYTKASDIVAIPLRKLLARIGSFLNRRYAIRFGQDPLVDIGLLSKAWGMSITCVFDVGANEGQFYQMIESRLTGATIHSFEPHPTTFLRLQQVVRQPSRCYPVALGEQIGTVPFYVYGDEGEGSRINSLTPDAGYVRRADWKPDVSEVECTTLDALCAAEGIDRIDLLKIDVEGLEMAVLRGGVRLFAERRVLFVFVEFNNLLETSGAEGGDLLPIANFLAPYGFRFLTSYADYVMTDGPLWMVSNALFVRDPNGSGA